MSMDDQHFIFSVLGGHLLNNLFNNKRLAQWCADLIKSLLAFQKTDAMLCIFNHLHLVVSTFLPRRMLTV